MIKMSFSGVFLFLALALTSTTPGATATKSPPCGYCDPGMYWSGVSYGAYRFDSSVPEHLQQAAYWAEDEGWGQYYDQNDSGGVTISVGHDPNSGVFGWYDNSNNTIYVNDYWVNECSSACIPLIGTVNHEFGHALGFDDIESGGCSDSIMSYENDWMNITSPSSEDLCWFYNYGWNSGPNWECPEQPCVPYRKIKRDPLRQEVKVTSW